MFGDGLRQTFCDMRRSFKIYLWLNEIVINPRTYKRGWLLKGRGPGRVEEGEIRARNSGHPYIVFVPVWTLFLLILRRSTALYLLLSLVFHNGVCKSETE